MWILIGILLVIVLYLFLIAPNMGRQEKMKPFEDTYIAHRGLFNNNCVGKKGIYEEGKQIPENSIPAFERAVEAGYGIELDVQTTSDGRLVVFHDENLKRMCGVDKKLYECTYDELMQYHLLETDEKIPLFDQVLRVIDGRVPLIVEVKSEGNWKRTTRMTAERLDSYSRTIAERRDSYGGENNGRKEGGGVRTGEYTYCVESFHPLVLRWFRKNRPEILRGQLSTDFLRSKLKRRWHEKILLTNLMLNFLCRPDFIAYNYRYRNQPSLWLCRHVFSVVTAAWTVKSEKVLNEIKPYFDIVIFDGFIPKKI